MIYKRQRLVRSLCLSAAIAAVYAVLTLTLPVPAYGPVQLRMAEAPYCFGLVLPGGHRRADTGLFPLQPAGVALRAGLDLRDPGHFFGGPLDGRAPKRWMAPIPPWCAIW